MRSRSNWSSTGSERATITPSAVRISPRGSEKARFDRPDVAGVVGQAVGLHHLEVVELDEQGQEAADDDEPDPADLAVHGAPPIVDGPARRATSSEIRSRRARITKLASSDDPP